MKSATTHSLNSCLPCSVSSSCTKLTWQNGDLTSYRIHHVKPADKDDMIVNATYDSYPNIHTGKPLTDCIFDRSMMLDRASKHNLLSADDEYTYDNGRLVITKGKSTISYFTFSDGTTGRK